MNNTGTIQGIQAFPLNASTFQGTAASFKCKNFCILKMAADGDVTIKYESGASTTFTDLKESSDFSIPDTAVEITSTVDVLIS